VVESCEYISVGKRTYGEAIAQESVAFLRRDQAVVVVPKVLVPAVTKLVAREEAVASRTRLGKNRQERAGERVS